MIQTNDITSLVPICKFSAHGTYITRVLLSPDTRHLATCSADHTARIWAIAPDLGDPSVPQPNKRPAISSTPVTGSGAPTSKAKPSGQGAAGKVSKKAQESDSEDSSAVESSSEEDDDEDDEEDDDDDDDEDDSDVDTPSVVKRGEPVKKKLPANNTILSAAQISNRPLQHSVLNSGKEEVDEQEAEQPLPLEMTLQGHQRWVWDCAFSADSAYLVTACSDHYARLWELSTQSIIRQYNGHHRGAVCVALNDTAIS
jgi:G protein beta subunit-like protein